jgi:hypothetical protein
MKTTSKIRKQTAIVVAVSLLGVAALTGCTSSTPVPQRTVLTMKSASAYYAGTVCKVNAADNAFTAALDVARQSTSQTGPDLDNLKAAALAYEKASRAAIDRLDDPKVVWPTSIRKSILVLRDESLGELPVLKAMAAAEQMSDAAAASYDFPDTAKAIAAVQHIRSTLGLQSDASNACAATGPTPAATPVAPATGMLIEGTGYTFRVPEGWTVPKDAPKADAFAISAKADANGVFDTVNVLPGPANSDALDEIEKNAVSYLEQVTGAKQVTVRPRVKIADVESVHISSLHTKNGISEWDEQYSVEHSGITYIATFAFSSSEPQAVREALAESVWATWAWS